MASKDVKRESQDECRVKDEIRYPTKEEAPVAANQQVIDEQDRDEESDISEKECSQSSDETTVKAGWTASIQTTDGLLKASQAPMGNVPVFGRSISMDSKDSCTFLGSECSNFAKLIHLSKSICQDIMREILRKYNPRGPTDIDLHNFINIPENRAALQKALGNSHPYEASVLLQSDDKPLTYETLDFSAMYKIARNTMQQHIPGGWCRELMEDSDDSLSASIERLRLFRNEYAHSPNAKISDSDFKAQIEKVKNVIVNIEKQLQLCPKYSRRVATLPQARLAPTMTELEKKSCHLEAQIAELNDNLTKQSNVKEILEQIKDQQRHSMELHRKLEKLYKASYQASEGDGLLQRNLRHESIGDNSRDSLTIHLEKDEYFVRTAGTKAAWVKLDKQKAVIIAGSKGTGKAMLAHHLLFELMAKYQYQTHILDKLDDVRGCFKHQSDDTVVVMLEDLNIDKNAKQLIKKLKKDVFKEAKKRYLIITSLHSHSLSGLQVVINLSGKEYALTTEERQEMLRAHIRHASVHHSFVSNLNERDIDEISQITCCLEFPLACSVFASNETYWNKGSTFFGNPLEYLLKEIENLVSTDPVYEAFFIALLLQTSRVVSFENDEYKILFQDNGLKNKLDGDFERDDLADIGEELSGNGLIIHKVPHRNMSFEFSNETVITAAHIFFVKTCFWQAVNILNLSSLAKCITFSTCVESACRVLVTNRPDKKHMAEKCLYDILCKKVNGPIWTIDAWKDEEFVDIFVELLFGHLNKKLFGYTITGFSIQSILQDSVNHSLSILCEEIVKQLSLSSHFEDPDVRCMITKVLYNGCRYTTLNIAEFLVDRGADLNYCPACSDTSIKSHECVLHCAVLSERENQEVVKFLLKRGAILRHSKWKFWKFLEAAAKEEDSFLCNKVFLRKINESDSYLSLNQTARTRMEEFINRTMHLSSENEDHKQIFFFQCLELVGLNEAMYNAFKMEMFQGNKLPRGPENESACHLVLESCLPEEMELRTLAILAQRDYDLLNATDESGCTPLCRAIILGNQKARAIKQLLVQQANPNISGPSKLTPLHRAILSPHTDEFVSDVVKQLVDHRAKVDCKDTNGHTPLTLAIEKGRQRQITLNTLLKVWPRETPLPNDVVNICIHADIQEDEKTCAMKSLLDFGANPNEANRPRLMPVANAAKLSYINVLDLLLKSKADIHAIDKDNNTLLHYCSYVNQQSAEAILDLFSEYKYRNELINVQNSFEYFANVSSLCKSIIWRFINMEPDVRLGDKFGDSLLHHLVRSTLDDEDVLDLIQVLVTDFHAPISQRNEDGKTPILLAFDNGLSRFQTVKFLLSSNDPDDLRYGSKECGTELFLQCISSKMEDNEVKEILHILIFRLGFSPCVTNAAGLSPLRASMKHDLTRSETIAMLLQHSTGVLCLEILHEMIEHKKLNVAVVAAIRKAAIPITYSERDKISLIHVLVHRVGHLPTFQELLSSFMHFGCDVNTTDAEGYTPLFCACKDNYPNTVVTSLLAKGAKVHITTRSESAIHCCVRSKRSDIETKDVVLSILQNGVYPVDINTRDAYLTTALSEAVIQGKLHTVKALLENDADPNIPDREGKTALHHCIASHFCNERICNMLDVLLPYSNIHITDGNECTALNTAARNNSYSRIFTIIRLLTSGCTVKTVDRQGRTPLHNTLLCFNKNTAYTKLERLCRVEIFLQLESSPVCKDNYGKTALELCQQENMQEEYSLFNQQNRQIISETYMEQFTNRTTRQTQSVHRQTFTEIENRFISQDLLDGLKQAAEYLHDIEF